MNPIIMTLFIIAGLLRLGSLVVSTRNEKALKANGAIEYGRRTSQLFDLPPLFVPNFKLELGSIPARDPGGA
jgi:isoprenylcysteine carboxyl methyltransferase (ICMT) family protein YpbQ